MSSLHKSATHHTTGALESRNRQIAAVHTISRLLSSTLDLDDRLRDILKVSMQAVTAQAGTIYLHRPEDSKLVFQYVVGPKASELTGVAISDETGIVGTVFNSGEGRITNHPGQSEIHRADLGESVGFITKSILTVPLKFQQGQPVGIMQMLNKKHGEFDQLVALTEIPVVQAVIEPLNPFLEDVLLLLVFGNHGQFWLEERCGLNHWPV